MVANNSSSLNDTGGQIPTPVEDVAVRAATLILMQCLIIPGNALILCAICTFGKKTVSDVLIGCLALIDLINGLGPVNISISMYYVGSGGFQGTNSINWLCLFYAWTSICLRLMACFVATLMSLDRFAAIVIPLYYRTQVTPKSAIITLVVLLVASIIIASLPLIGVVSIRTYTPLCSFDFTSPFAVFVVVLGYLQLLIVILCYVSLILGVNAFLSRQTLIKASQLRASIAASKSKHRDNTLADSSQLATNHKSSPLVSARTSNTRLLSVDHTDSLRRGRSRSLGPLPVVISEDRPSAQSRRSYSVTPLASHRGSLSRIVMSTTLKRSKSFSPRPQIKLNTDICYIYSEPNAKRGSDFEIIQESGLESEDEAKVQSTLKDFKRNSTTWKHSRRLAIVMGIVVLLFYISWMPIVIAITLSLASQKNSQTLHFTAARMTLVSSMLNFFVYGGMLKQYRSAYKIVLKKLCGCGESTNRIRPEGEVPVKTPRRYKIFSTTTGNKAVKNQAKSKRVHFKTTQNNAIETLPK